MLMFGLVPRHPIRFDMNCIFKEGYFRLGICQIKPHDEVLIGDFKSEGILSFEGEVLIDMLVFESLLADGNGEDVGCFRVVPIFGDVVEHQGNFFFLHGFLNQKYVYCKDNQAVRLFSIIFGSVVSSFYCFALRYLFD